MDKLLMISEKELRRLEVMQRLGQNALPKMPGNAFINLNKS